MENRSMIESNVKRGSMLRFSIGTKLTITFLALAIIPMSAIAYYNLTQNRDEVIKLAKENLIELSRSTAYPIEQLITENQRTSATLAGDPLVAKFLAASEEERQALTSKVYKTLQNFADTHPDYDSPGLLDENGIVVAALADILVGKDRSFRDYFKASIQGKSYISDILVGRATKRPGVFLTNPVISAEGEIVGINIIWLKADTIWNIIDDVLVGKEGIAYLVDQDGVIIAHPNRDLLYHSLGELTSEAVSTISSTIRFGTIKGTKTPVIPKTLGMDQLSDKLSLAQVSGNYRYYSPLDHRYHVVGYTPLKTQPWTVVVDLPEAQFLAPLEEMRTVAWVSVGLVAMITFIISIILVRGIIRPIRRLADVAVAVEHQQPFEPSDIEDLTMGHDEIAYLGRVFSGMVLSLRNELNERKQTEEALRESETKLQAIFNQTYQFIGLLSTEGRLLAANDTALAFGGLTESDVLGKFFWETPWWTHDAQQQAVLRNAIHRAAEGELVRFEAYHPDEDGDIRFVDFSVKSVKDDTGAIVFLLPEGRDITERKQAEKALRQEEEKFRVLVEESPLGISFIGEDAKYKYINPKFIEIFRYTLEDIPSGKEWFKKAYPNSEYRDQVISTWIKDLKDSKVGESRPRIFEVTCKNGEEKIIHFKPVTMATGDQFVIYEDITNRQRLEDQLRQSQKAQAIGTLAGGIAHDFNNILSPIILYAEMVLEDISGDSPLRFSIEEILGASIRAKDLVRQILTFSRQAEQERIPLIINPVIKEALRLLRASLPSTIEIRQNLDAEGNVVLADPTQIHQILMNLGTNAANAMRERGGVLEVSLVDADLHSDDTDQIVDLEPGQYIKLTVSDTGHGIEPAIMDKIFDPYFTTQEKGKGTGLGLSLVLGIVSTHGGHISAYSEPGKGTRFDVYLPLFDSYAIKSETVSPEKLSKGDEHILLVDDEKIVVDVVQQMLERLGYQVTVRTSSIEALEAFRASMDKFDLVITDLTMPNMTGDKLAGELMNIRPDIPIILCTGFSEMMSKEKTEALGIKGFLMKPIVKNDLTKTVREVLDKSQKK